MIKFKNWIKTKKNKEVRKFKRIKAKLGIRGRNENDKGKTLE